MNIQNRIHLYFTFKIQDKNNRSPIEALQYTFYQNNNKEEK